MAIVTVNGRVDRRHRSGDGFKLIEETTSKSGEHFTQRWTVWPKSPADIAEGDLVTVNGFHGARIGDPWTGRDGKEHQSMELSIRYASVTRSGNGAERPQEPAGSDETSNGDGWSSGGFPGAQTDGYDPNAETPF